MGNKSGTLNEDQLLIPENLENTKRKSTDVMNVFRSAASSSFDEEDLSRIPDFSELLSRKGMMTRKSLDKPRIECRVPIIGAGDGTF